MQTDIIQWFSLTTEIILSIQFSLSRTPTAPKPEFSPLHMNLYLKSFAETNLAEQPFQRDSWTRHISIRLQPNVSTTSLALPCIIPTFHEDTCNLHILHTWCCHWMTVTTSNLFLTGNDTISIAYDLVVQHSIIWHFGWFDWDRKFYWWMLFLM